jgi:hypothetical protein
LQKITRLRRTISREKPNPRHPEPHVKTIQPSPKILDEANCPALQNPTVAHCAEVWERVYKSIYAKTKNEFIAEAEAGKAYRQSMPPLCGYQNICDFIACAGYGMLLGAIENPDGTKLLYAAQVALSTIAPTAKTQTRLAPETAPSTQPKPAVGPTPPPSFPVSTTKEGS